MSLFNQGSDQQPESIRLEIQCENDLFFYFSHDLDEESFKTTQESQKLCINFNEYAGLITKLFNNCINEPHSYIAVFIMQREGTGRLDFIQNIEYKFIELLSVDFVNSNDTKLKDNITYRYNAVKQRLTITNEKLKMITDLIKKKNPTVYQMILKMLNDKKPRNDVTQSKLK